MIGPIKLERTRHSNVCTGVLRYHFIDPPPTLEMGKLRHIKSSK